MTRTIARKRYLIAGGERGSCRVREKEKKMWRRNDASRCFARIVTKYTAIRYRRYKSHRARVSPMCKAQDRECSCRTIRSCYVFYILATT